MKTHIALALFWSTLAVTIAQATPLTVAVYDFKGDGKAAGYGNNITTLVTAGLSAATNLVMVERAELNKALSEQAFGVSGMVSSDAAAKVGQITGAKILVAGQAIRTGENHIIIVANIIGTETGRLFIAKVEGATDNLIDLTSDLSRNIARTIQEQATNLAAPPLESSEARQERIIKMISGTNRPSISIKITSFSIKGRDWQDTGVANELGLILMKAGFPVVDENSDSKPDVEIIGSLTWDVGKQHGNMNVCSATLDVKVSERRTGVIKALDHQESTGTGIGPMVAIQAAKVKVADDLAERLLPLLAK